MANSTLKGALAIHGGNPQFLIEKVIRARIYDSIYWKEQCFALTAESIIDKAIELKSIGGVYGGNQKPTEFLSLALKLLVLQPEKAILLEYLKAEEFKYLRALTAFYIRLTFRSIDVYETLEPLLSDYRKLRVRNVAGYALTYMDEFIDDLLTQERVCDVILPRLTKREVLEDTEGLKKRKSTLEMAMNGEDELPWLPVSFAFTFAISVTPIHVSLTVTVFLALTGSTARQTQFAVTESLSFAIAHTVGCLCFGGGVGRGLSIKVTFDLAGSGFELIDRD